MKKKKPSKKIVFSRTTARKGIKMRVETMPDGEEIITFEQMDELDV